MGRRRLVWVGDLHPHGAETPCLGWCVCILMGRRRPAALMGMHVSANQEPVCSAGRQKHGVRNHKSAFTSQKSVCSTSK
eukprot:199726-Pelagomonas_calceolata.AAC.1